jgi:hypothetical protein
MSETTFSIEPTGPNFASITQGIFQSDIIIKSAIEIGLKELKANPGLIEDMLAGLPQDDLTSGRYGSLTIAQAKKWFADSEIEVMLGLKLRYLEKPSVVCIELGNESENETTLADRHYDGLEDHPRKPGIKRVVESLHADATFTIACFAQGEPELMLFLASVILFICLRRKEDLFDARGYVVSKYSMGTASLLEPNSREMLYMRTIQLNGKVRHIWPKKEGGLIESVPFAGIPEAVGVPSPSPSPIAFSAANWENMDILSGGIKLK